jgi:hypothetical protein
VSVQASCPGCGAAVEFKFGSSLVTVCKYCRSVVARGDRKLEDLGKVAALVDTESPLAVGLHGKFHGNPFEITGRAQLGHSAGGVWDEWYAAFPKDHWGWLAEAQGRFYLTFPSRVAAVDKLPPFEKIELGESVPATPEVHFRVAEKGRARMVAAEGEIPYRLEPGQTYSYADLSGPNGAFGTIDYSDATPQVFLGHEVTLDDLGMPRTAKPRQQARQVEGLQVNCPHCGGALDLRAPDKSERVACPSCASLLELHEGNLRFLTALKGDKVEPVLPLGSVGTLPEGPMTVIGMLERSVTYENVPYFWEEYLLYEPRLGFRWLVRSDHHWNYVKPLPPGDVHGSGLIRQCHDRKFKLFQKGDASVTYVIGECYWKVSVGETVQTADYVSPPEMLSREMSISAEGSEEINWSLGTYLTPDEVETAFKVRGLRRPWKIGPNQPYRYKNIYRSWGLLSVLAGVLAMFFVVTASHRRVYDRTFGLDFSQNKSQEFFTEPIELQARRNIQVTVETAVNNTWLDVQGAFVNDATGVVQHFEVPVEYYQGVDGGESWSEGGQHNYTVLSSLPAGKYTLALYVEGEPGKQPRYMSLKIDQGVPRWLYVFLLLLLLSVFPLGMALYHLNFEYRRWQDSDYSPFHSDDS